MRVLVVLVPVVCVALLASVGELPAQYREEGAGAQVPVGGEGRAFADGRALTTSDTTFVDGPYEQERLMYLAAAALGFGLFDYIGYNLARNDHEHLVVYRVLQGLVHIGISWLLYEQLGLPTAIGFNVLWWTWGIDAIFYGYTELFNVGGSWHGRGEFKKDILGNNCFWASWTPVGLAQGADPKKKIAGDTIVAQTILGAILAVTITVHF